MTNEPFYVFGPAPVTADTHTMRVPQLAPVPLVDLDRGELERRIRERLMRHRFVLVVDDDEVAEIARDLADAVVE